MLAALLPQLLHAALLAIIAPGVTGLVRWIEAAMAGRGRPAPLQPYADLARLLRKETVVPESASSASEIGPALALAALVLALLLVPSFALGMISAPAADLILIAGLLALARAAEALAALDTGSAEGTLAGRATAAQTLAEPALLAVILPLALLAGTTNLDALAVAAREGGFGAHPSLVLALAALAPAAFADLAAEEESGAALAEAAARRLALARLAGQARLLLWLTLIATIAMPFGDARAGEGPLAWLIALALFLAKLAGLAVLLGLCRPLLPRLRMASLPRVLAVATGLGLLAAAFVFARMGPA